MARAKRLTICLLVLSAVGALPSAAQAAGPPQVIATWVTDVGATGANLRGEIHPNGLSSTYRFEYITEAAYQANLAALPPNDGFTGASRAPVSLDVPIGAGGAPIAVVQHVGGLTTSTSYRYRIVAANSAGVTLGPARPLTTNESAPVFSLPDNRGWEMVSPVDKNGGQVDPPQANLGGGVLQAASDGNSATYSSSASFAGAQGAPQASQYISRRTAGGWLTENLTTPLLSGGYEDFPLAGVPYRLFSTDLARGLLSNGRRCRSGAEEGCPVANPSLPGSGAPTGYRNYYLRTSATASFEALLGPAELSGQQPEDFEVTFAGASADLSQVVLSSCSALTADAVEVPGPEGCDPQAQNLYLWSGSGLSLVNLLPGQSTGAPGAELPAQSTTIAAAGSRVYWTQAGNLYLREGAESTQLDSAVGGGGQFQIASADGSIAYFGKAGHLYRYLAGDDSISDLTPGGGLIGVLGASEDGSRVYYSTSSGIFLWQSGTATPVAPDADPSNYPPTSGTTRVSPDGSRLAFISSASLTDYDSAGVAEAYLYDATADALSCVSCNPSGERPLGPASIPGALVNGATTRAYRARALSSDGSRLFFDSFDALVPQDTNSDRDVYQWEAQGKGSCTRAGGCTSLISSGRSEGGASFVDASADGSDVFFLTDGSLAAADPGSVDLYDARVGGGFPSPQPPIPCIGDACQPIPPEPEDPSPGTALRSLGNPPLRAGKAKHRKRHHKGHPHKGKGHGAKRRDGR